MSGDDVKQPPLPVCTQRNSWFRICHATRIHIDEGFYKAERGQGVAVQNIIELYPEICLQLYFVKENCQCLTLDPLSPKHILFLVRFTTFLKTSNRT